ncbi:hypothetical protein PtA15_10A164 [Puccinia triticina]|uniref:Uncharacterized protein n=1 Tax=Puccinia triticina TaxID=208348 RepID=A0ABY7CY74_9BASI|nr:uncharacterized protein PtA15_10A164 [Puccinia triticina]WAQ88745.1 hypothetical protein PtA15_10A164 [Puccinia triticina]
MEVVEDGHGAKEKGSPGKLCSAGIKQSAKGGRVDGQMMPDQAGSPQIELGKLPMRQPVYHLYSHNPSPSAPLPHPTEILNGNLD